MTFRGQLATALIVALGVTLVAATLLLGIEIVEPFYSALGSATGSPPTANVLAAVGSVVGFAAVSAVVYRAIPAVSINIGDGVRGR